MSQDNLVKLVCSECKNSNYHTFRNKKKVKEKLSLKKYCKFCKKHTDHNEKGIKK